MTEFKMPSLGAEMEEGTLTEWKVKPGDVVKRGDIVAVVNTDKAAVEVEVWQNGTIDQLKAKPGDKVPVGAVLALIRSPEEKATEILPPVEERIRVSPAAKQKAAELGVEIKALKGSGPGGAITLADVEARGEAASKRPSSPRSTIAAAMTRSKREIPHYYLSTEIDMQPILDWLATENAKHSVTDRILYSVPLLKGVALALKQFPELNGFLRDGKFEPSSAVHVGVAISLKEAGLVAPALHDVDKKAIQELMQELQDLVTRARKGSLRSSEFSDPTVTVTNLGENSAEAVYGVIYPPQVALIGFGEIVKKPWVKGEQVALRPIITATLSADHRVSDGHRGALFLAALRRLLENPESLLQKNMRQEAS